VMCNDVIVVRVGGEESEVVHWSSYLLCIARGFASVMVLLDEACSRDGSWKAVE
jgi:hypothetical protein